MNSTMTPAAEKFIRRLLRFDGGPGSGFRLAGHARAAAPAWRRSSASKPRPRPGEQALTSTACKLFLAAESRLLLDGVTIDFADTPLQSGLRLPRSEAGGLRRVETRRWCLWRRRPDLKWWRRPA